MTMESHQLSPFSWAVWLQPSCLVQLGWLCPPAWRLDGALPRGPGFIGLNWAAESAKGNNFEVIVASWVVGSLWGFLNRRQEQNLWKLLGLLMWCLTPAKPTHCRTVSVSIDVAIPHLTKPPTWLWLRGIDPLNWMIYWYWTSAICRC